MNTSIVDLKRARQIAALNDHFRHWSICLLFAGRPVESRRLGNLLVTRGIAALAASDVETILRKVATYADFTDDNDPHREHDFGAFDHAGQRIFWKIDYFAPDMQHRSEDPADPQSTHRVLTVMLAGEY